MEKVLLSIIIPTYNGAGWIEDTLRSVLCQLPPFSEEVEFIVRDNCSTDSTRSIVERLNREFGNLILYDRRDSTILADMNYREAVCLSHGDFFVLLGDDDLLFPHFIANILEQIKSHREISYFYCNRITTSRDYKGATLKHIDPSPNFYKVFDNPEQFIHDYPSGPDFMSVNVIKRECFEKGLYFTKEKYYGVEWYSIILCGLKGQKCMSFFYPMILQRVPRKRVWDDRGLLFVIVGVDNLFSDISEFYPTAHQSWYNYSKTNVDRIGFIFKGILLNRTLYKEKWEELKVKLNTSERILAYTLLHFPFSAPVLKYIIYYPNKVTRFVRKKIRKI